VRPVISLGQDGAVEADSGITPHCPIPAIPSRRYRLNQLKLMVYLVTKIRFQAGGGQAAVDQVGPLLDFFSLRLMMRTRGAVPGLLPVRFPGPVAEPGVAVCGTGLSTGPAVRRGQSPGAGDRGSAVAIPGDRDLGDLPQFNPVRCDRRPWPGRVGEAAADVLSPPVVGAIRLRRLELFYPVFAGAVRGPTIALLRAPGRRPER
jgi:hypothetical protein